MKNKSQVLRSRILAGYSLSEIMKEFNMKKYDVWHEVNDIIKEISLQRNEAKQKRFELAKCLEYELFNEMEKEKKSGKKNSYVDELRLPYITRNFNEVM